MTALILLGLPAAIAIQPTEHAHIGLEPQRTYHTHMERQARLKRTPAWQDFSATVDGKSVKAIDMIRFNDAGKIDDFEVMVRPKSGLDALAAAMGARLASQKSVLQGASA